MEGIFGDETTPVIDVPNHTSWVGDKRMTQMSANDEQNGDDAKMMKRRTQGKQEDYAQPHADWLLAAPTIIITSYT